ncbi:MAG: glycosyltransferase family 2 protein [Anaerolineales bacterium]
MHCPKIFDLPPSPTGKMGWPWNEESPQTPDTMQDGSAWPRISIVTPSFNQAQFIEETIRSVLLQGYPNLEYIIMDGGSTDGSVDVIKKYATWLTYWVSEPDRGQPHAINTGFAHSTGEIMAWINSDDYYAPDAFRKVAEAFSQNATGWVSGRCSLVGLDGSISPGKDQPAPYIENWLVSCQYTQPNVFWKRSLWERTNKIDEQLHFSFDYELWMQFAHYQAFAYWIETTLAFFRMQPQSKTVTSQRRFEIEDHIVRKRYGDLARTFRQKSRVSYLRRVKKASHYLSLPDHSKPPVKNILYALYYAPWYIFRGHFYRTIKNIL